MNIKKNGNEHYYPIFRNGFKENSVLPSNYQFLANGADFNGMPLRTNGATNGVDLSDEEDEIRSFEEVEQKLGIKQEERKYDDKKKKNKGFKKVMLLYNV